MNERIEKLRTRINAMSLRERVLLFLATLAVLVLLSQALLFGPLERRQKQTLAQIKQLQKETAAFESQIEAIMRRQGEDPDAANRRLQEQLQTLLGALDRQIGDAVHGLISPQQMVKVLEQVLVHQGRLKLVHVESIAAKPLVEPPADQPGAKVGIYKHGLRLEFEGDYLSALDYLKQIEKLPWVLYWDELELTTDNYPRTRIVVVVHTLSLNEGWIGV